MTNHIQARKLLNKSTNKMYGKTFIMVYEISEDSDQPGQMPRLSRVFAVHLDIWTWKPGNLQPFELQL